MMKRFQNSSYEL